MRLAQLDYENGKTVSSKKHVRLALGDEDEVIRLMPGAPETYGRCAYIYQLLGQFDRAASDYTQAMLSFPTRRAEFLLWRGGVHLMGGR